MADLFEVRGSVDPAAPLAERMRPDNLDDYVGQEHLVGEGKLLRRLWEEGRVVSLLLWGPPGTGKTTLARLLVNSAQADFVSFSAVLSGVKEVRDVVAQARDSWKYAQRKTVLFVDEIHRFNKAQQDAFLPHVESGLITLIGATTENPSFEVIPALVSRMRVLVLYALTEEDLTELMNRALNDSEKGLGASRAELTDDAKSFLVRTSHGDARSLLNGLELAVTITAPEDGRRMVGLEEVQEAVQKKALRYDKDGEEHYNLISALHKSLRDSDPDGALYWLARMLEGGEDPLYLLRRMVRFASEDVGLADPLSLLLGTAAVDTYRLLGSPEGDLALAHLAVHLATAEKSNAVYSAFNEARKDARELGPLPVPLHIRNAPTKLMKGLGYGRDYKYAHDYEDAVVDQDHLPEELNGKRYYHPTNRGRERAIAERISAWRQRLGLDGKDSE
jgi:putative ATPase